jgi:hypothetical protein
MCALGLLAFGCTQSSTGGGGAASTVAASTSGVTPTLVTSGTTPLTPTAPAALDTGPRAKIDPTGDFFAWPWPNDARRDANDKPDLSGLPNPRNKTFIRKLYAMAGASSTGFSPTGAIYLQFDGPINAPADDPVASRGAGYPVLLVGLDPNSPDYAVRQPIMVKVTDRPDTIRPANLLQVIPVPGRNLRHHETYALIVLRELGAPGKTYLGQDSVTTTLLDGKEPLIPQGAALARATAPLVSALQDLQIHPQDIAAATVFTTGDPTETLVRQAAWAETQPAPLAGALRTRDVYPEFTALQGDALISEFQDGFSPYISTGGRQVQDPQGNPVTQRTVRAPFQISIPKGPMPAKGWPLYFYCHGTGGKASQAIDRGRLATPSSTPPLGSGIASYVAPDGWGTACIAGPFSPDRIGILAADGYLAYNFLNPTAMRDNFIQMVLEQIQFRQLLLNLRIDPALCPGTDASASPDGKIRFDPDAMVVGGQSLGSYLAGMLAAVSPNWKGVILTGAGGSWVEFPFGPKVPIDLQLVIELLGVPLGEKLDRWHPLIMAFDLGVGPADNTHYHRYILREPLPGRTPPHVFVIEGFKDLQVPTGLQRALVQAIGLDFVGSDPGTSPDLQLLPILPVADLDLLSYPVSGNRTLANGQSRTAVVVRYPEDGIREGHYVSFQLDAPKLQSRDFLSAIKAGTTPLIQKR